MSEDQAKRWVQVLVGLNMESLELLAECVGARNAGALAVLIAEQKKNNKM